MKGNRRALSFRRRRSDLFSICLLLSISRAAGSAPSGARFVGRKAGLEWVASSEATMMAACVIAPTEGEPK